MSNLLEAVRTRSANIQNIAVEITGQLEGQLARFAAIVLHITADYDDKALLQKLITIAERACIVANTLLGRLHENQARKILSK